MYWYKFMWLGKLVRESTKQSNDKVARQMEAAHRTSLAQGEVGLRERKPAPSWFGFRAGIRWLTADEPLSKTKLNEITNEKVAGFAAHEQTRLQNRGREEAEERRGMAVSSINSSLRVRRPR